MLRRGPDREFRSGQRDRDDPAFLCAVAEVGALTELSDETEPGHVKKVSMFLLDNMMLFFIPVGVGLITSYTLLSRYMLAIIVASLVSTVLVIAVVGLVEQKLESKKRSKKEDDDKGDR